MAQDIFLKLTGIEGEAADASHSKEIEVLTWEWSVKQPSNMHAGRGGGAGKATVEDLTFEHYVDCATPNLVQYCLTGKHIGSAVLTMRKAGGKPLEFLRITMEDVLITQVKPAHNINMRAPREEVSLATTPSVSKSLGNPCRLIQPVTARPQESTRTSPPSKMRRSAGSSQNWLQRSTFRPERFIDILRSHTRIQPRRAPQYGKGRTDLCLNDGRILRITRNGPRENRKKRRHQGNGLNLAH